MTTLPLPRWTWVLALLAFAPAPAAAQPPLEVVNLRVGFEEYVKNGSWTPIWLDLKASPKEGFSGILQVVTPDDDDAPTIVRVPIELPPGVQTTETVYVRPGKPNAEIDIGFYPRDSRRRLRIEIPSETLNNLKSITAHELLIATIGNPQGVASVESLANFAPNPNQSSGLPTRTLIPARVRLPGGLPDRWIGYDAVDTVVLDATDEAAMREVRAKWRGLRDWVAQGGHLIVAVGSSWTTVSDSELASQKMLPALPTGLASVSDFGALEAFADSRNPLVPTGGGSVQVAKLQPVPGHHAVILDNTVSTPLVVRGTFGFGVVTVIALDVAKEPFASWKGKGGFWAAALNLRTPDLMAARSSQAFAGRQQSDYSAVLRHILDQFPNVRLVPFGWVAFLIFIYILIIGPGDYFFLKKVLKRMELTWITFPIIVITVSVLAYSVAYAIKGTDLLVNKLEIVDYDQESNQVRGTALLNLFSPENLDYNVTLAPLPLDRSLSESELSEAVQTAQSSSTKPGDDLVMSWFGAAESIFGGQDNPNRLSFSSNGYTYGPAGYAKRLEDVRVAMWSSKCLMGRWQGSNPNPILASDLKDDGNGRLLGSLTNVSQRDLIQPRLFYGDQVYELETLSTGGTVTLDVATPRLLSGYLDEQARDLTNYAWDRNDEVARRKRRAVASVLMFMNGIDDKNKQFTNGSLRSLDLTTQLLDLGRPMLVAEVQGPAAAMDLGQTPTAPKMSETTVLRVLLPLGADASPK